MVRAEGGGYDNDDPPSALLAACEPAPTPPIPAADEEAAAADHLARLQRPSKTRRKEASHELQALGAALVELSDERLAGLGLSEPLLDADPGVSADSQP